MQTTLAALIKYLSSVSLANENIIPWSCPVLCFGDPSTSTVATLGLNPSNREFVDDLGNELDGPLRRFHTLSSLGLNHWDEATAQHLQLIIESYHAYFLRKDVAAALRLPTRRIPREESQRRMNAAQKAEVGGVQAGQGERDG